MKKRGKGISIFLIALLCINFFANELFVQAEEEPYVFDDSSIFDVVYDEDPDALEYYSAEAEEIITGVDVNAPWAESDFTFSGSLVTGLSDQGREKLYHKTNLSIPETGNGITITGIKAEAFMDIKTSRSGKVFSGSLSLPETITRIDSAAFKNAGLTGELHLHNALNWIAPEAFMGNELTAVTLPDELGPLGWRAFQDNKIEKLNLGALKKIKGSRWSAELNYEVGGILSYSAFRNNKIKELIIPEDANIWAIGAGAFSNNELESLIIPKQIVNIYEAAFYNNATLTNLSFAPRTKTIQIDYRAFSNCNITGTLVMPDEVNEAGGYAFANNKITELVLPKNSMGFGYSCFANNPIVKVSKFRPKSWLWETGVFEQDVNNSALKNVSFQLMDEFDITKDIPHNTFRDGRLRSLEIPSFVTGVTNYAFRGNVGWYPTTPETLTGNQKKVALYTMDKNWDYDTNPSLKDGQYHIVNPVLVKARMVDETGAELGVLNLEGENTRGSKSLTVRVDGENFNDFKLGDSFRFQVPVKEGFELLEVSGDGVEAPADSTAPATLLLSKDRVREVKYDDSYEVGYKEAVITLKYKDVRPKPTPVKVNVKVNFVDENGAALSKTENVEGKIRRAGEAVEKEVSIIHSENKADFLMDDVFSFTPPALEGYDLLGAEGKGVGTSDAADLTKPYTLVLSAENVKDISSEDGTATGEKEAMITLKYKKKQASTVIVPPVIGPLKPKEEDPKKEEPKKDDPKVEEPKKDDPKVEEPSIPIVETSETVVVPVEEDEIPQSDTEVEKEEEDMEVEEVEVISEEPIEEGLDLLDDSTPRGDTEIEKEKGENSKPVKENKPVLALTGGLLVRFSLLLTLTSILIGLLVLVSIYRKRIKKD